MIASSVQTRHVDFGREGYNFCDVVELLLKAGLVCTASCSCACAHRNHNKFIGIIVFCLIFETSVYIYPTGHWAPRLEKQYVSEYGIGLRVMSFCHLMRR